MTDVKRQANPKTQALLRGLIFPLVMIPGLLLLAGRLDYWQGWVYIGVNLVLLAANYAIMRDKPDLMQERLKAGEEIKFQTDRGQTVCDRGPYRFVRHPGYVGGILFVLTTPLILGSLWGLVPQGIAALLLVARTALEDRTLRRELPGYDAYAEKVKFRLIPGIW